MRTCVKVLLAVLLGLAWTGTNRAADAGEKVAAQKKAAAEAWQAVEAGPGANLETKHLLIWAPQASEGKLKSVGVLLEKYYDQALKTLGIDPKDLPEGKITVYLFADRDHVTTFARRVEKRRPSAGELGSFKASDDMMHAAGAPSAGKVPVPAEVRAGEQLAALLLARRAGKSATVPDWVFLGFGRANTYRLLPTDKLTQAERKHTRGLTRSRNASDLWSGSVDADDSDALQGSVMDFLAFGPGSRYLGKFLEGFRPEEGKETKSAADALTSAGLTAEKVDKAWKNWAAKP
jgi:hypothetical protein